MWCLWYADGSTVDSTNCDPVCVPGYGVQVIGQPDRTPGSGNVGYTTLRGYDWFYWRLDSQEWLGCMGDASIWDLILHREPIVGVCQGRRLPDTRFAVIRAAAEEWARQMNLPAKSAFRPDERS